MESRERNPVCFSATLPEAVEGLARPSLSVALPDNDAQRVLHGSASSNASSSPCAAAAGRRRHRPWVLAAALAIADRHQRLMSMQTDELVQLSVGGSPFLM